MDRVSRLPETAHGGAAGGESAFRRRWNRRVQLRVAVLGSLAGLVARVLYATLRVQWSDPAGVVERHIQGERFIFACWHDGLLLLPLTTIHIPGTWRPRLLISWHRDAELGARAARRFGVSFVRGSSTRGGIGPPSVATTLNRCPCR